MFFFEAVLFYYFTAAVFYTFLFAIAGQFYKRKKYKQNTYYKNIAVFVPGYKEDNVILTVAERLTKLDYPKNCFDIIVLADSFKSETLEKLSALPITLIPVKFEKSSKAKSLNYALHIVTKPYDVAVILDADNITQSDFLLKVNDVIGSGVNVAQAQRVAKNTDTSFAVLDACSEAVNNHLFRKGPNAMGLSGSLIGSGMAFDYQILKNILSRIESVYEDREIQFELARMGIFIEFIEGVMVFDEKIDNAASFQNQRRRWLYAQVITLIHNFIPGHVMLLRGNFTYYNFAVLNNLFPPRLLTLVLLLLISFVASILNSAFIYLWWSLLLVFIFSLAISLPARLYNKQLLIALFSIPKAFLKMIQAILKMKGASTFIHTAHSKVNIDSVFKNNDTL